MTLENLLIERDDAVAIVTFNRPKVLNALNTQTLTELSAVIADFKPEVPGNYTLVDHALARAERGLLGILSIEGPPNPDIFNGQAMPGMGH